MNRLLKAAGMPTVLYRTKAPSSFVALSNIESFVAAAKAFGVPETSLFQPSDLVDGRKGPLLYVLNCLNQLGIIVRTCHRIYRRLLHVVCANYIGCLGGAVVERWTRDRKVAGSTPGPGAIKSTRSSQPSIPPG